MHYFGHVMRKEDGHVLRSALDTGLRSKEGKEAEKDMDEAV